MVLVPERLAFNRVEIRRFEVFQFDDAANDAADKERAVRFFRVVLVLLLGDKVVIVFRINRVTEDIYEEFA